jgi:lipid-A-disaccharide synthase-like uncharacterized protein
LPKYLEAQHSTAWQRFALRGAVLFGALFFSQWLRLSREHAD